MQLVPSARPPWAPTAAPHLEAEIETQGKAHAEAYRAKPERH